MARRNSVKIFLVGAILALGLSVFGEASKTWRAEAAAQIKKTGGSKRNEQRSGTGSDQSGSSDRGGMSGRDMGSNDMGYGSGGMGY